MSGGSGVRGDVAARLTRAQVLEAKRMRARELWEQGVAQVEIARVVGVHPESVRRWRRAWEKGGREALRRRQPTGRPPKVDAERARRVEEALLEGALAHGFESDLWTLERVRVVAARVCGVELSVASVWRLLTVRLGWSLQVPERRARERDEAAIARWVATEWPRIKGGPGETGMDRLRRRSGHNTAQPCAAHLRPARAHPGAAPHRAAHKRLDDRDDRLHPDRERTRLCFELREGSYDTPALIEALTRLGEHYAGENLVMVRDNASPHHSRAMRDWAATQPWLTLEKLPAYAPELNPVERLWSSLKTRELANRATTTLTEAADAAQAGIHRITTQPELPWSYLTHTRLDPTPQTPQNF